jgi:hypothetical protein
VGEGEEGRGRGEREEATSNGRNREVTFLSHLALFPCAEGSSLLIGSPLKRYRPGSHMF